MSTGHSLDFHDIYDDDFDLSENFSNGSRDALQDENAEQRHFSMELTTPISSLLSSNLSGEGEYDNVTHSKSKKRRRRATSVGRSIHSANYSSTRRARGASMPRSSKFTTKHTPPRTFQRPRSHSASAVTPKSITSPHSRSIFFLETDSEFSQDSSRRKTASRERMLQLSQPRSHAPYMNPECTFHPKINHSIEVESMSFYDLSLGDAKRIETKREQAREALRQQEEDEIKMFRRKQRELLQSLNESSSKWFDSKRKHELFKSYKQEKVDQKMRRLRQEKEQEETKELTFQPAKAKPVPAFMQRVADMRKKYNPRKKFDRDRPEWHWQ